MRRIFLPALMITLLLTGCGGTAPERKIERMREVLTAAQEIQMTADVTANLANEVFQCTLRCMATPEQTTVEVAAPETVAGVRAVLDPENMRIEYGDLSLGVAGNAAVPSPVTALPLLLRTLREGSCLRSWTEWEDDKTLFVREYYVTDDGTLTLWLDSGTLLPLYAEFRQGETTSLRCEIREFTYR